MSREPEDSASARESVPTGSLAKFWIAVIVVLVLILVGVVMVGELFGPDTLISVD